jgi:uncharacterized protein YajQ (UPF0234 family)
VQGGPPGSAQRHPARDEGDQTRFDLKGTGTEIELVDDGVAIEIRSSEELKLKNGKTFWTRSS